MHGLVGGCPLVVFRHLRGEKIVHIYLPDLTPPPPDAAAARPLGVAVR